MKVKNWLMVGVMSLIPLAAFAGGNGGGNGGGLIERNGKVLSFKSANTQVKLNLQELNESDLPEIGDVEKNLDQIILPPDTRTSFRNAIKINGTRKYFKASLRDLNHTVLTEILKEYKKVVSPATTDKIVLAAITKGNETFLFDAYFSLNKPNSKQAILIHEALWVLFPKSSYRDVILSEIEYETCIDDINVSGAKDILCEKWVKSLSKIYGESALLLRTLAYDDFKKGRLDFILTKNNEIPVSFIFGSQIMSLTRSNYEEYHLRNLYNGMQYDHIQNLITQYPEVTFLKELKLWSHRLYLYSTGNPESSFDETFSNEGIRLWEPSKPCASGPPCKWSDPNPFWTIKHKSRYFGDTYNFVGIFITFPGSLE
jgi:hypothetical protein